MTEAIETEAQDFSQQNEIMGKLRTLDLLQTIRIFSEQSEYLAKYAKSQFEALEEVGFTHEDALALTGAILQNLKG